MINKTITLLIVLILTISFSQSTFGNKIDSYNFSLRASNLPMGGGKSELYSKIKGKAQHTSTEETQFKGNTKPKVKKRKLKMDVQIENTINRLDSLLQLTEFRFTVNKSIIDSIKAKNDRNIYDKIPTDNIDKFFINGNTVLIKLKYIKQIEMEQRVMDGNPFVINLKLKRPFKDTVKYDFEGNFAGGIMTNEINKWLPFYLCYRQTKFFETMPMENYFSDENLVNILMHFIDWTK